MHFLRFSLHTHLNLVCLRYRLAAIDHGLFSFIDVLHKEWPVVLVTNPKHALYHMSEKEHPRLQAGKLSPLI